MLQIIVRANEQYSAPELAQMAIEGGCQWVEYIPGGAGDTDARDTLSTLTALCRESGVMLTIVNSAAAAREHGLHGVLMPSAAAAMRARDELGPEAIVGAQIESGDEAPGLDAADIDYAACPYGAPAERVADICKQARAAGAKLPIVARGDYALSQLPALVAAGASAVALAASVTEAADPALATSQALEILAQSSGGGQ